MTQIIKVRRWTVMGVRGAQFDFATALRTQLITIQYVALFELNASSLPLAVYRCEMVLQIGMGCIRVAIDKAAHLPDIRCTET